jgi:hypothetical protein
VSIPGHEKVGLPPGAIEVQALYNVGAAQTLLEVKLSRSSPIHRLYWRRAGETTYTPLGSPAPDESFEQAVTCKAPFVYMQAMMWRPLPNAMGGRPLGVRRVSLGERPTIEPVDLSDLLPQEAHVSRLLRADDDGSTLTVVVNFMVRQPGSYRICSLDLVNRQCLERDTLYGVLY